jgi:DNA-binding MurR/RpiR family transcriptional regulator
MNSKAADGRSIDERITSMYEDLTASERRLAAVVLGAQLNLSSFTASELAAMAEISNATAARFFKRLGFKSYNDARAHARRNEDWGSPLYELTGTGTHRLASGDLGLHVAQDLQNLTRTAEAISGGALDEAVKILAGAERVWIVGFRNSMILANYACGLLIHLVPYVHLLPRMGMSLGEDAASFGPKDALLVLGFRRRPALLREIMEVAREAGMPRVLIADATAVRTAQIADVTLRCQSLGHSMFDSYVAPMSIINFLCASLARELGDDAVARLSNIEDLHSRLDALAVPVPLKNSPPNRQKLYDEK